MLFSQILPISKQANEGESHHKYTYFDFYMNKILDLPYKTLKQLEYSGILKNCSLRLKERQIRKN